MVRYYSRFRYKKLRGPPYALPDVTDTHAIVPTISTPAQSAGELDTYIYIYINNLNIMKVNGVRGMVCIALWNQVIRVSHVLPVVGAVHLLII